MTYAFPGVRGIWNAMSHARTQSGVVVVESDSAGPSATVTEVRNMCGVGVKE